MKIEGRPEDEDENGMKQRRIVHLKFFVLWGGVESEAIRLVTRA